MKATFSSIWIHLIWTTKNLKKSIKDDFQKALFSHIKNYATHHKIYIDSINGTSDHIHCLISIKPNQNISVIVNKLKGESSHWINSSNFYKPKFIWQRGFGAFSVSYSQIEKVRKYIRNQMEYHKLRTYKEELNRLAKKHKISYK
mgnify:CR=1 FL=1